MPELKTRLDSIDALRGFALAGILFSHMVEQFIAGAPNEPIKNAMLVTHLDQQILDWIHWLIQGKFFALFSILFGLSYSIQLSNGLKRTTNRTFSQRYLWRLAILLLIGLVHSLFYSGDILSIFALVAIFMLPFNTVSQRTTLIFAIFFIIGGGRYLRFLLIGYEHYTPQYELNGVNELYLEALTNGSLLDVMYYNCYRFIDKWNYQLGIDGRAYLTFGYFLLGLWAGRQKLIQNLNTKTMLLTLIPLVAICLLYFQVNANFMELFTNSDGETWFPKTLLNRKGVNIQDWVRLDIISGKDLFNTSLTFILALTFLILFRHISFKTGVLASYGRMALSNYLLQSLISTFILYNWGLGYIGELSNTTTLFITISIIFLQLGLSYFWIKYFHYGPLEWVWRSLTYFKAQKFRKQIIT